MFVIKPEDFIGKQFGHYQLVEFLKGGGFGLVYKAEHLRLHRTVALKLLKPELNIIVTSYFVDSKHLQYIPHQKCQFHLILAFTVTLARCRVIHRLSTTDLDTTDAIHKKPGAKADTQFDTQSNLLWVSLIDISEHSNLVPLADLHVALEQIAGDDEMLDLDGLPFYQAFRPPVVFADLAWGGNIPHHKEKMMGGLNS